MEDKAIQFLDKLGELPGEAQAYLSSKMESQALKEIQKDYQLSSDDLDNIIYDIFIANFDFAVLDADLKATKVPVSSQSHLASDILGKIFLPIAPFLKLDIKTEMIKRGHRPEIYGTYVNDLSDLIEDKNFETLEALADLQENTFDPVEEENVTLELFSEDLAGVLTNNDPGSISNLNGGLVYLLINKPDFHNKINKILFAN